MLAPRTAVNETRAPKPPFAIRSRACELTFMYFVAAPNVRLAVLFVRTPSRFVPGARSRAPRCTRTRSPRVSAKSGTLGASVCMSTPSEPRPPVPSG